MKIPTEKDNPKGLHQRYHVSKVSGEPIDENAEYFVLRLDSGGDDLRHIEACRCAINTYAVMIGKTHPELASDLISRYSQNI